MSVIREALEKAAPPPAKSKNSFTADTEPAVNPISPPVFAPAASWIPPKTAVKPKRSMPWRFTAGAAILLFSGFAAFLFFKHPSPALLVLKDRDLSPMVSPMNLPMPGFSRMSAAPASFLLTGISTSSDESFAVINGEVISVGDSVGSAVVREIQETKVVLEERGKLVTLNL